ncbi:7-carboxy-7-deazaguanine synthase QueE [Streptomyces sp. NPDC057521]|uniref:7-carboxy-7-deazaguanine synthase QueE n=1 Tax=Streptomyces sp. NPDC057521 TaxID=3346156 RepID=UPI0036893797
MPNQMGVSEQIIIAETFGPTIQGEGPSAGQSALFIRLSRCNLSCQWCDTPFTWDTARFDLRAESRRISIDELAQWALGVPTEIVVITGGEPLIQQDRLVPLVELLVAGGRHVEIETNGTFVPLEGLVRRGVSFNVSPKLTNSGVPREQRISAPALKALRESGQAVFKFVVQGPQDLAEVDEIVSEFQLGSVYVMPEGTTPEKIITGMQDLVPHLIERSWSLTPRLHVLLWGDERGR